MTKIEAMARFNNKCAGCGKELKPNKEAHFHHLRSYNKEHNMSDMFNKYSEEATLKELNKTILLCSDCHKALHKALGKKVYKKQSLNWLHR